jgi:hypothetical protein
MNHSRTKFYRSLAAVVLASALSPILLVVLQILASPRRSPLLPAVGLEVLIYAASAAFIALPLLEVGRKNISTAQANISYFLGAMAWIICVLILWQTATYFDAWILVPMLGMLLGCMAALFLSGSRTRRG